MLLFQVSEMPWWATVIGVVTGIALGLLGALPWRSSAQAATSRAENAEAERDAQREAKRALAEENALLKAEVAVLKARTDLDGLRAEMIKEIQGVREEFKHHSDQDLLASQQHVDAVKTLKSSLDVVITQLGRKITDER